MSDVVAGVAEDFAECTVEGGVFFFFFDVFEGLVHGFGD